MAEFMLKDMVERVGISDQFEIASAATTREEIGNPVYPPARRKLKSVGIDPRGKYARQVTIADYQKYDYLIVMDSYNLRSMRYIIPKDPQKKICRLLDFTDHPRDIADPWYTDDFDTAYEEIKEGLEGFLRHIETFPRKV